MWPHFPCQVWSSPLVCNNLMFCRRILYWSYNFKYTPQTLDVRGGKGQSYWHSAFQIYFWKLMEVFSENILFISILGWKCVLFFHLVSIETKQSVSVYVNRSYYTWGWGGVQFQMSSVLLLTNMFQCVASNPPRCVRFPALQRCWNNAACRLGLRAYRCCCLMCSAFLSLSCHCALLHQRELQVSAAAS